MKERILFIITALIASHAYGGFSPPGEWKVTENPQTGVLLMAFHNKSAMIGVLKEDRESFEVKSLLDFTKLKIANFRITHGITEATQPVSGRIAEKPAWIATFRTVIPNDDGTSVDVRMKIACFEHQESYYTIMLSSKIGSESIYYHRFIRYLNSVTLK